MRGGQASEIKVVAGGCQSNPKLIDRWIYAREGNGRDRFSHKQKRRLGGSTMELRNGLWADQVSSGGKFAWPEAQGEVDVMEEKKNSCRPG